MKRVIGKRENVSDEMGGKSLEDEIDFKDRRLILVSNAEPYAHKYTEDGIEQEKLAGGLTTALNPLMQKNEEIWIAWGREDADFEVTNAENEVKVPDEDGYILKRVKLSETEVEKFYRGFSNEILWPLCHSFPEKTILSDYGDSEDRWGTYQKVNRKFAEAVIDEYEEDDLIWVHDYHLALVPKIVREEIPDPEISVFWHIPWPPWEMFGSLPWREEILEGLLSSDFTGFHTEQCKDNFLSCSEKIGREVDWGMELTKIEGNRSKVSAVPLGIDYEWFVNLTKKEEFRKKAEELKEKIPAEIIILGVDRLDYTKGIPERLRSFEHFLEENPTFQGKVTLLQRIPPSRRSVKEYQSILNRINMLIGEINGKFEKALWTPIKSFHRFLPEQKQLIPYYMMADVGLVTPLIDGMNLVCKEYIASTDNGALVLSEFAGAAEELREAIQVNPYDIQEVSDGIKKALTMSEKEKKERMKKLKERIKKNDLNNWRKKFLNEWLKEKNEKLK